MLRGFKGESWAGMGGEPLLDVETCGSKSLPEVADDALHLNSSNGLHIA